MRYRLMATYLGVPYPAGLGPDGTEVTLFSPAPPPEELGFTAATHHWRKQLSVTQLDALWQSRPVGHYRDEPCLVLDEFGDRLHIVYLGRDAVRAAQLGYWEIDREVFEVVVARHDVTNLTEERVDVPLAAATFPATAGLHAAPDAVAVADTAGPQQIAGLSDGQAVAGSAAPTGYGGSAGPVGYGGSTRQVGYAGSTGNGRPAGHGGSTDNGRPAGHGGADHTPRVQDRVAAWHGSPAPWPEHAAGAEGGPTRRPGRWPAHYPQSEPWTEPWTERPSDPEPWTERPSGPEPWTEREPSSGPWTEREPSSDPWTERESWSEPETATRPGRRKRHKDAITPESVFAELLTLSAIPPNSYAVDEEIPGAMCLVKADGGFEVFSRTDNARLEVRFFEEEEAAYFYLFGILAAEAVHSGRLGPTGHGGANGRNNGSGAPRTSSASAENVSKYLRGRKLPKSLSHPARVKLAGGADGPPLPKQPRRPPEARLHKRHLRITNQFCHCQ